MTTEKPHIDVLVLVPLTQELDCLFDVFKYEKDLSDEDFQFNKLQSPTTGLTLCLVKLKEMGNAAARDACNFVLQRYTIGLVVCYGIAGGLKKDVRLLDVCVSHRILDLTDQSKIEDHKGAISISPSPRPMDVDASLCSRLAFMCENPAYSELRQGWEEACLELLLETETNNPTEYDVLRKEIHDEVKVFFGPIVSHAVVASDSFTHTLKSVDRNVLAIDTESAGVFEVSKNFDTPAITIRGVSDYADNNKGQLEIATNEIARNLAALNAAHYLRFQLMNSRVVGFLNDRRPSSAQSSSVEPMDDQGSDPLDDLLSEIENEIDSQLKEVCPAYRHKRKGSLLPTPRVMRVSSPTHPEEQEQWATPSELTYSVEQFERLIITLEPTYPDKALPWVIANAILRTNGSRLFIPIVIDGTQVSPNRFQVLKLPHMEQVQALKKNGAIPVLIIDDPDLQSKTRVGALIEEANKIPDARFVVVAKKYNATIITMDFAEKFSAERFEIANFSLGAISDFVASNFGFDLPQSAVLATKLNETFEQFNMHAHPSYFAGISPEILTALIGANRRGELIQLAVEGALMILVAADEADVHVSKSWRREYLKDIVVRQFIKGETIDETRAIELARDMAERRDIEIKPLEFVQSFVAAGILNFYGNSLQFCLVYVRDYLIAEYLHENPSTASSYFNFDGFGEDFNVLDIYAELGPSTRIVDKVASVIEADIALLQEKSGHTVDNLISNKITLTQMQGFRKLSDHKRRLLGAIEYVGENPEDLQRKQHLLDFKRTASRCIAEGSDPTGAKPNDEAQIDGNECSDEGTKAPDTADQEPEVVEEDIPRSKISVHWTAGSVVLRAGAEQIDAEPKRRLAKGLISLGCRIAEDWTAQTAGIDFEELRKAILNDPTFIGRKEKMTEEEWDKLRTDFDRLMHVLEFTVITGPYRAILATLCGQTNGNVLRKSVKEAGSTREFERLTQAVWASDLDAANAERLFKGSIRRIRNSPVLQFLLAEHFVSRVYWDKWRPADRRAFLGVATRIMDDLDTKLDKGQIKRRIEKKERITK